VSRASNGATVDPFGDQATSQIAQERAGPGPPGTTFVAAVAVLAAAGFGLAAWLGTQPYQPVAGELAASAAPAGLLDSFGLSPSRLVSAAAVGGLLAAAAVAGRRLLHSEPVALLAGGLVLLDPGILALGRLAMPDALVLAGLAGALALFLSDAPWAHWAAAGSLGLAAAADPRSLVWGLPLGGLALLRGHIYAAPRHLGLASLQALGLPILAAGLHLLATNGQVVGIGCQPSFGDAVALAASPDYGGVVALHNPVTWFGGLGALVLLAAGSLSTVARQFRLARLPGRIQMRLGAPLEPIQARMLWLLLLALLAPFPSLLLVLAALALAAGIGRLAEDAPGFGVAVGFVILVFAVLALWRAWAAVSGTGPLGDSLDLVPWTHAVACAP